MTGRARNRLILQLPLRAHVAKEEPTATHVAASHEVDGEQHAFAEHRDERVSVLSGRDAAEQDHLIPGAERGGKLLDIAIERHAVPRAAAGNVDLGESYQVAMPHEGLGNDETAIGGDHVCWRLAVGTRPERPRVRQFATEVQAAEKAEYLANRGARGADSPREIELGAAIEQQACTLSVAPRR